MLIRKYILLFVVVLIIPIKSYSQKEIKEYGFLKEYITNDKPLINEIITIRVTATIQYDQDSVNFYFHLYQDGIEVVEGEPYWKGQVKKGQEFTRQIKVKFRKRNVYLPIIYFNEYAIGTKIYVDGAFEEDARVRQIRGAIKWIKEEIESPHPDPIRVNPDVVYTPEELEIIKEHNKHLTSFEMETIQKNDSLLQQLKKEYEDLDKELQKKNLIEPNKKINQ